MACDPVVSLGFDGAAIYERKCADCHGPAGQGSDYHQTPLTGDLPVSELARVIAETMPEDDPGACVGAEAEAVAAFVHASFYSPLAQARIRPPRRELSRLTARQFEQSLADLFAEFRPSRRPGDARGLLARFEAKVNTGDVAPPVEITVSRIDLKLSGMTELPEQFTDRKAKGSEEHGNSRIDVHLYAHGGLMVPATGDYEFEVHSPNAVQLHINGEAVIDARVRSDAETVMRGAKRLVGGRVYPIELRSGRTREDDLLVSLLWKRPGGAPETLPTRYLVPEWFPAAYATSVKLPADDRSVGYVRGASVSSAWDEAVTAAALDAAQALVKDLPHLARPAEGPDWPSVEAVPADAARAFCERFATASVRRPLKDDELMQLVAEHFDNKELTVAEAAELSLLAVMKNPRFLYPELSVLTAPEANRRDHALATRLASGLWDSLPDRPLRERAGQGGLAEPEAARMEARRMLDDPRTRAKMAEFFEHWLRLDHVAQLSRDPEVFPDFSERVAADMRTSLELLVEDVVFSEASDLRQLFLSEELYVNGRLADFLGLKRPDGDPEDFVKAPVDTQERAGVVSHPYVVTAFSYYRDTSPIHRGVFLARHVLGRSLRPPPEAVPPLAPELAPDMTTRERVAKQTSPDACQACHVLINDLGFTLEKFDAVGRFREQDVGKPIDSTGGYIATDGGTVRLAGARDLAHFLANSEDVHRSFVTQLFEHVTKQPALAYGLETRERLLSDFRAGGFNIRNLLVEIAVTAALSDL